MSIKKGFLGPVLVNLYGGHGLRTARQIENMLLELGIDPSNGAVRVIVADVPEAQGLRSPSLGMIGSPFAKAVNAANAGKAMGDYEGFDWLQGHPPVSGEMATLRTGAAMHQSAGRFAFCYTIGKFVALVTKAVNELLQYPDVKEGLTLISVCSSAGGAGGAMALDGMYTVQAILESLHPQIINKTRRYAVVLGPQSFIGVSSLHDSLRRNTGSFVKVCEAIDQGKYAKVVVTHRSNGRDLVSYSLQALPFDLAFMIDVTRDEAHNIGDFNTAAAVCADVVLALCHRGVSQTVAELILNPRGHNLGDPGAVHVCPIARVGIDSHYSLRQSMLDWLAFELSGSVMRMVDESLQSAEEWLRMNYPLGLQRFINAHPEVRFEVHDDIREIINHEGNDNTATNLQDAFSDRRGVPGLISRSKNAALAAIDAHVAGIHALSGKLEGDVRASKTPGRLRAWRPVIVELIKYVSASSEWLEEYRKATLVKRSRTDTKFKMSIDEKYATRAHEKLLKAIAEKPIIMKGNRPKNIQAAAQEYVRAVWVDLVREIDDDVYTSTAQALQVLHNSLIEQLRTLDDLISNLSADAENFDLQAAAVVNRMRLVETASPSRTIVGMDKLDAVFAASYDEWLEWMIPKLQSFGRDSVLTVARGALVAIQPTFSSLSVNGAVPDLLWSVAASAVKTETHPFHIRVNPHDIPQPTKVDGITDLPGDNLMALSFRVEAGLRWIDLGGILEALFIAGVHPLQMHAEKILAAAKPKTRAK